MADASLDEDELVGALDDVVLVAQKDHVSLGLDDAGQVLAVAERARLFFVADGFGFLAGCADVEAHEIDVHADFLPVFVYLSRNYWIDSPNNDIISMLSTIIAVYWYFCNLREAGEPAFLLSRNS